MTALAVLAILALAVAAMPATQLLFNRLFNADQLVSRPDQPIESDDHP